MSCSLNLTGFGPVVACKVLCLLNTQLCILQFAYELETRSSAQGNCSAKSLAGNVVDSSLSSLCFPQGGSRWGEGVGEGEGRGEGAGDILSTLPHMTLPLGASP